MEISKVNELEVIKGNENVLDFHSHVLKKFWLFELVNLDLSDLSVEKKYNTGSPDFEGRFCKVIGRNYKQIDWLQTYPNSYPLYPPSSPSTRLRVSPTYQI